jgi:hypothetical protein
LPDLSEGTFWEGPEPTPLLHTQGTPLASSVRLHYASLQLPSITMCVDENGKKLERGVRSALWLGYKGRTLPRSAINILDLSLPR